MNLPNKPNNAFHNAIRKMLRPIVRMAISRGVAASDFYLWLKAVYVQEAENFTIEGRKQNASRIALLTGMDRKEVAKLRTISNDMDAIGEQQNKRTNRAIRAINAWATRPEYQKDDKPMPLDLSGEDSFDTLVTAHCGDIPPSTILLELKQAGLVKVQDEIVTLTKTAYVPDFNDDAMLAIMGQASHDLLNTTTFNIDNINKASRLQLTLAYDNLNDDIVKKLQLLVEKDSRDILEKLNAWLIEELKLTESNNTKACKRAGIGMYYFEEEMPEPNTEADKP